MARPWELAGFGEEAHACPLGGGWWRGPAPRTEETRRALAERGIREAVPLADGSFAYRVRGLDPAGAGPDREDPAARAAWIAARLDAARSAWRQPFPVLAFMAVLNLAPDSFSDGGRLSDADAAARAAARRRQEGAAWLDLGAESTRPGAGPVAPAAQLERLLPALEAMLPLGLPVSIDTRSAEVAAACLDAGAEMINDVSALSDPAMAPLAAERGCWLVLMHMRGTPADMQRKTEYRHLLGGVLDELAGRLARALAAGVAPGRLIADPGIGFAKTAAQSLQLQGRLGALRALGFPVLAGPSRKSFMREILEGRPPQERDGGTAGAAAVCAAQGAAFLRLHRGGAVWDAARVAAAAGSAAHAAREGERPRPTGARLEVWT